VTVIKAGPCWVTQVKTEERDGYTAVQLGFEQIGEKLDDKERAKQVDKRMTKPERGHLGLLDGGDKPRKKLAEVVPALLHLREFDLDPLSVSEGQKVTVEVFKRGDHVDVVGSSKGKGFAGTIKRHHFNRQPKTHGASDRTRAPGSIGSTTTPGRVRKGQRMAGRMGGERVTTQNLEVVVVDAERHLLALKGSVPGAKGGLVTIRTSVKAKQ